MTDAISDTYVNLDLVIKLFPEVIYLIQSSNSNDRNKYKNF